MFIRAINDNGAQRKLIDHFRLQERLAPGSSSGLQKYYGMKNETNVIVAEFRLSCMDYFYPPNCSTFCKSQDNDQGGHYDCHPETGEKECKEGYLNPATNCTECAPASGCCKFAVPMCVCVCVSVLYFASLIRLVFER